MLKKVSITMLLCGAAFCACAEMALPTVTAPEVKMPTVTVTAPEVKMPEVQAPETTTPDVALPDTATIADQVSATVDKVYDNVETATEKSKQDVQDLADQVVPSLTQE